MCLGCGHKYRPPSTPQQAQAVPKKQATLTAPVPRQVTNPVTPPTTEASKATATVQKRPPINLLVHRRGW